jgi:hypothetical protein
MAKDRHRPRHRHHELLRDIEARKRREAARSKRDEEHRLRRREARKRRDAARRRLREEARKRRRAARKRLREAERKHRDALRRLARHIAREQRDAERALLRKERRLLLSQRYVTRMALTGNRWVWYRVSGPSYSQAARAVRGQKAQYPRRGERRGRPRQSQGPMSWL